MGSDEPTRSAASEDRAPPGEFSELSRLPLRRPALAVNAPALTWHLGKRMGPSHAAPAGMDAVASWRRDALLALNNYLAKLQRTHGAQKVRLFDLGAGRETRTNVLFLPRDTIFFIVGEFDCVRLRLCVDMHEEYYTLTLLADGFQKCTKGIGLEICKILHELDEKDCVTWEGEGRDRIHRLYDAFWERLTAQVTDLDFSGLPGALFVSVRGMAMCPPLVANALSQRGHPRMQLPSHDLIEQRRRRTIQEALIQYVDRRPNFFAAALGMRKHDAESAATDDANAVLCGMLDGAAVFGTGLKPANGRNDNPLRYFVLYDGFSSMQLGRLIRRLHVLVELRMAALLDLEKLRGASDAIRAAGYESDLDRLTVAYAAITGSLAGGLNYRISQSRYYTSVYREKLQDLRIVRMEGWQPYDEFVRRTVFRDFNFVDQIGYRYEALGNRMTQASDTSMLRGIMRNQRVGIATQKELRRLQALGEPFGAAAFTYYFAHVLNALYDPGPWLAAHGWLPSFIKMPDAKEPSVAPYVLAVLLYPVVRKVASKALARGDDED
jgi:hypothetical protein